MLLQWEVRILFFFFFWKCGFLTAGPLGKFPKLSLKSNQLC